MTYNKFNEGRSMKNITKLFAWFFWALLTISFIVIASTNAFADDLSREEVVQLISGNTVEAVHAKRGNQITTYYSPDGTFRQIRSGERQKGTWYVNDDGELCKNREGWGGECRVISKEGDVWKAYKIPSNIMKGRKHKRTFNRILKGNKL